MERKDYYVVTTFYTKKATYKIIRVNEKYYGAINAKDIDKNGILLKSYNGIQMFLNECIEGVINSIQFDELFTSYRENHLTFDEAFSMTCKEMNRLKSL